MKNPLTMKKTYLFPVLIIMLSLVFFSFAKADKTLPADSGKKDSLAVTNTTATASGLDPAAQLTSSFEENLNLDSLGLSKDALDYAIKGYEKLVEEGKVDKDQYLTIVDLSQSSRKKRFYILDTKNNELVWNTYVAHGKNSGLDQASNFSNSFNSEASSLGFYLTKSTYTGKHGMSLRISGLEDGFNDNAEARGVVVHGAPYVNGGRVNSAYMGRSQGCPALPVDEYAQVINIIKGGSVLFVYYPSTSYLHSSQLLNS
jgi:hypothetical protein